MLMSILYQENFCAWIMFSLTFNTVVIAVTSPSRDDTSAGVLALELERQTGLRRTISLVTHVTAIVVLVADPMLRNAPAFRKSGGGEEWGK